MHPLSAKLPRQTLRQLPHARPARPVRCELRVRSQRAQRARENQRALLLAAVLGERGVAVVFEEEFQRFLRKGHCAADVSFQTGGEVLVGFCHEGLFGRMFDAVDCEFEFERVKGRVGADCGEGFGDGGWGGVRGEGLDDGVWGGGFEGGGYLVEGVGAAGEEGDGEVAVGGVGEDASDACALMEGLDS